jgi:hypothetical protein
VNLYGEIKPPLQWPMYKSVIFDGSECLGIGGNLPVSFFSIFLTFPVYPSCWSRLASVSSACSVNLSDYLQPAYITYTTSHHIQFGPEDEYAVSSEAVVSIYKATCCHSPEHSNLNCI